MYVPVGPFPYKVMLVSEDLVLDGEVCDGLCDRTAMVIKVSADLPPAKRLAVFWHEFGHALKAELDAHQAVRVNEETLANLIGLAMVHLSPRLWARLHLYLTEGVDAEDIVFAPGMRRPVPLTTLGGGGATT